MTARRMIGMIGLIMFFNLYWISQNIEPSGSGDALAITKIIVSVLGIVWIISALAYFISMIFERKWGWLNKATVTSFIVFISFGLLLDSGNGTLINPYSTTLVYWTMYCLLAPIIDYGCYLNKEKPIKSK